MLWLGYPEFTGPQLKTGVKEQTARWGLSRKRAAGIHRRRGCAAGS
jgi:hypothetical protein